MQNSSDPLLPLIQKVAAGDNGAVRLLYDQTSSKLFGVILRILKRQDVAEEVCQDVYITIWEKASQFNSGEGRVISWMTTIARNRAIDVLRSREEKMTSQVIDCDFNDEMASALALQTANEVETADRMSLAKCLDEIEQKSRECVLLAYQYGLSRDELAERYDVPSGTVKTWLRRALLSLKSCLER